MTPSNHKIHILLKNKQEKLQNKSFNKQKQNKKTKILTFSQKFLMKEIIKCRSHNKTESKQEIPGKPQNICRWNNMLLKNTQVKQGISKGMKNYYEDKTVIEKKCVG